MYELDIENEVEAKEVVASEETSSERSALALEPKSEKLSASITYDLPEATPRVDFGKFGLLQPLEGQLIVREGGAEGTVKSSVVVISLRAVSDGRDRWESWTLLRGAPDSDIAESDPKISELPAELAQAILALGDSKGIGLSLGYGKSESQPPEQIYAPESGLKLTGRFPGSRERQTLMLRSGTKAELESFLLFDAQDQEIGRIFDRVDGLGDEYLVVSTSPLSEDYKTEFVARLLNRELIEYTDMVWRSRRVLRSLGRLRELTGYGFGD